MSERDLISDRLWAQMEPLLPSTAPQRGGRWRSHRELLEAIAWRFRTGAPWRDLPERFGPWQTAYHRHNCWSEDGTYARLHQHLMGSADARGDLEWLVSVDSTIVRAHQHAAGARREDQGELAQDTGGSVELQGIPARAG
jgi:transposase